MLGVILATLLTIPPDARPAHVRVDLSYMSLTAAKPERYDIIIKGNDAARDSTSIPVERVDRILNDLRTPIVGLPSPADAGMNEAFLTAPSATAMAQFEDFHKDDPNGRAKRRFAELYADPRVAERWTKQYFAGRFQHTDDYPSVSVTLTWPDGTTYVSQANGQQAFMLPWHQPNGAVPSYNTNLSRDVAAILPAGALNRDRLNGENLSSDYGFAIVSEYADEFDQIVTEERLGSQLDFLRPYDVRGFAVQGLSSDDLDGRLALNIRVRLAALPGANSYANVTLFYEGGRIFDGAKALALAQKYGRAARAVPWLRRYIQRHPDASLEVRVVQDRSESAKLNAELVADLADHGLPELSRRARDSALSAIFLYVHQRDDYSRWILFPDRTMLLWNYRGSAPLADRAARLPTWDWYGHNGVGALFSPEGSLLR